MSMFVVLGFLICWAVCITARGYKPILLDLADEGPCKNDSVIGHFDLTDVPQFGAMCNLPIPIAKQYGVLVENNVVPILCMGVYDVFQRFCQTSSISRILHGEKDSLPLTSEHFSELFKTLNTTDRFSSLDTFCSSTVVNSTISESSSNVSQFWWNKLNNLLTVESKCKSVCRTSEDNKVHPLCSFIIWSNQMILKNSSVPFQKSLASSGKLEGDNMADSAKNDQPIESNQITATAGTEEGLKQSITQIEKKIKPETEISGKNGNLETDAVGTGDVFAPQLNKPLPVSGGQAITTKTFNISSPAVETYPPLSKANDTKQSDDKLDKKATQETVVGTQEQTNQHLVVGEKKATVEKVANETNKGSVNVVSGGKEEAKVNLEKSKEEVPEPDFTPDSVLEDSEAGLPIPDNEMPQTPFTSEDIGDGDDDDIETEVGGSPGVNSASNQNQSVPGNIKPGYSAVEPDGGPDKVYGEGEPTELMIEDRFIEAEDSHFFTYFLCMAVLTIMAYLAFHNKKKLVALALEGRRTRGARRRPNSSNYSKLDCNLEEALVSNKAASVTHVLY